jgi:hypothetical protein
MPTALDKNIVKCLTPTSYLSPVVHCTVLLQSYIICCSYALRFILTQSSGSWNPTTVSSKHNKLLYEYIWCVVKGLQLELRDCSWSEGNAVGVKGLQLEWRDCSWSEGTAVGVKGLQLEWRDCSWSEGTAVGVKLPENGLNKHRMHRSND